ncbi:hypothetical protein ACH4U7_26055 [Streptomyces sp. NPDC020845]|uniref:hypothetical protein n=1 Tax=Streptomyces sp. NPDC020845 TaxID=3365096 RepID=UPI00378CAADB
MATSHPSARQHKIQEALEARDALAAALTRAGIQLPAMDVRTPWNGDLDESTDGTGTEPANDPEHGTQAATNPEAEPRSAARYALVHLGVCSAAVAHALAEVIAKGAAR